MAKGSRAGFKVCVKIRQNASGYIPKEENVTLMFQKYSLVQFSLVASIIGGISQLVKMLK